jgi:cephalosporin hydroxylase
MLDLTTGKIGRGFRLLFRDPGELWHGVRRISHRVHLQMRPMRKDYRERFEMTLKEWTIHHQNQIAFEKCHWMGVRALKNPCDAWVYQEIVYDVRPDVILEIGSMWGGSTLFMAHLLQILGKGMVISLDIDRTRFSAKHDRIRLVTGSSFSPDVIRQVYGLCKGQSVLVIQDGAHDKEGVLKDLRNYSKLVSVNSYFIVEDGVQDLFRPGDGIGTYEEGPLAAVEQFLAENQDFVVDSERERYIMTYNPRGFLKRIR